MTGLPRDILDRRNKRLREEVYSLKKDKERLDWLSTLNVRATANIPNGRVEKLYIVADDRQPGKLREQIDWAMSRENGQVEVALEEFAKHHYKSRCETYGYGGSVKWSDLPEDSKKREVDAARAAFRSIRGRL